MNKEVMELWVSALRSNKYPQSIGALETTKGYCGLGVLCKIAEEQGIKVFKTKDRLIKDWLAVYQQPTFNWANFNTDDFSTSLRDIAELNDSYKKSFAEIADYIEQNWKRL